MTTDSFIIGLRRFIGRRGYVRLIRTDNGINFVGAFAELIESIERNPPLANKNSPKYSHFIVEDQWWQPN